jgi:uncharacterized membrane protein
MTIFARFMMILSLVVWIGGIVFFSFIVAPVVFSLLPAQEVAGRIVARSLGTLHVLGLTCGITFLASTFLVQLRRTNALRAAILSMILLTALSHFGVTPQMEKVREAVGGSIQALPHQDAGRAAFDRLHKISVVLECLVLLAGIGAVGILATEGADSASASASPIA